jgi:hypothetical protein
MSAEMVDDETFLDSNEEMSEPPTDQEALSPEELQQELQEERQTQEETPVEDDLPEKYRGKTPQQIARMHQEAERLIGKQSSEVGELRQFVDGYIKGQLVNKESTRSQEPEDEGLEFFENPKEAISRAIENHPSVQEASRQAHQYKTQTAVMELKQKHPDLPQVLQDPNFQSWVQGSKIRAELFNRADQGYDVDAADELISSFKERQGIVQKTVEVERAARGQQVRAASTGGGVSGGGASQGQGSPRLYRRTDLIKLMQTDPQRYEALSEEIFRAYSEGRVR